MFSKYACNSYWKYGSGTSKFAVKLLSRHCNVPLVNAKIHESTVPLSRQKEKGPDKKLFTPGPIGCSRTVKEAMLRDLGSRDTEFIESVRFIRKKLVEVAGIPSDQFTAIPLQGSGTYAVEGVLMTTTPRENGKVLVLSNGAYGKRMVRICEVTGLEATTLQFAETNCVKLEAVEAHLEQNPEYTTVAIVHSETSSGVLNPVKEVGILVKKYAPKASYFVDAMSSFGAIPLDMEASHIDFLVSSANKCLEGVPGFSFVIARLPRLLACKGNSRSLSLDLVDQYENLELGGQFRFTPPTHAMLAFKQALAEYEAEGGLEERAKRYRANQAILKKGMRTMRFRELLEDAPQGYIINSYHYPSHQNFNFNEFYERLNQLGQVIYPGKVTNSDCFRIGNIGQLYPEDMQHLLTCIEKVCTDMQIPIPLLEGN